MKWVLINLFATIINSLVAFCMVSSIIKLSRLEFTFVNVLTGTACVVLLTSAIVNLIKVFTKEFK